MKSRSVAAALVLALLILAPVSAQAGGSHARHGAAAHHRSANVSADKKKGHEVHRVFHVASGWTFTSPLNSSRLAIRDKLLRAINHTRRGQKIRVASWNFDSPRYAGALSAAHRRGVSVRLIMARTLANEQGPRGSFNVLRRNLSGSGNDQRKLKDRSWARTCSNSCRGHGGAMHAKYYVFSKTGASRRVVFNTSANMTAASSSIQWNELYTTVDHKVTYDAYMKVFNQSARDRPALPELFHDGAVTGWFYPRPGRSDLVMDILDQISCSGAEIAGQHGHTKVRVAQDVFNNKRGLAIARKLKSLQRQGCDLKVVYSQAVGDDIKAVIKSMPNNHLVQDRNGDGVYDRYLHAKLLAVSGHLGKDPKKYIVMDGSANYSATALLSDEQGMIFQDRPAQERAYSQFIDQMFATHLVSHDPVYRTDVSGRVVPHDHPYSKMEG